MRLALALAFSLALACSDTPRPSAAPPPATAKAASPLAHQVATVLPDRPCTTAAPCTISIRITALRGYHVNAEYPFKLIAAPAPGLEPAGTGAFTRPDEKTGVLAYSFRATSPGPLHFTGELRLSVCNDDECQIKSETVTVDLSIADVLTIDSPTLHETRTINVALPPGYASSPDARFPVLYMPDGGMDEDFPHVVRDVHAAILAHQMRPVIVVGIANTERRRDMTGPTRVASDRKIAPHVGGSAPFRAFIKRELIPAIDARYATDPSSRGIVGESLAGLFIVETFFLDPSLFDTYIAISPSLFWNHGALARAAAAWLKSHPDVRATLYLTNASDDDDFTSALAAAITSNTPAGLTFVYQPMPAEHHDTIYLAASPTAFRKTYPPRNE